MVRHCVQWPFPALAAQLQLEPIHSLFAKMEKDITRSKKS